MVPRPNLYLSDPPEEDPKYIHDQRHTAEDIFCHGFEPAPEGAVPAKLVPRFAQMSFRRSRTW